MKQIPADVFREILLAAGSKINFVLGFEPDRKQLFLDGGPSTVLESILQDGADIKSLLNIKKYVPAAVAILKAVETADEKIVKRVCIMWDIWTSDNAFTISWDKRFLWGIKHIKPISEMSVQKYNQLYFEVGLLNKINLDIESPFEEIREHTCDCIKAQRLTYTPYRKTINKETLLRLLIVKGQFTQALKIFQKDVKKELPLNYILHTILEHVRHKDSCPSFLEKMGEKGQVCYEFVTDIINEGGYGYELDTYQLELVMTEQRNTAVLASYFMPMIELHRAVINKDADTINKYMDTDREETVELLIEHYIGECGREHHDELTYSSKIKLGSSGEWINLNNPSTYVDVTYGNGWEEKDVSFLPWGNPADLTVTEGDLQRVGMTWMNHASENDIDARYVLKYLDINGYEELNEADEIKLSHNLEANDIPMFHQLVHNLLEKEEYTIKKVEDEGLFYDEPYECPLVYYQDKSIRYTYKFVERIQPACIVRRIARATDLAISLDTYMNMANLPPSHPPAVMVNLPRLFHHFDGKYRQSRLNFCNNQIRFV